MFLTRPNDVTHTPELCIIHICIHIQIIVYIIILIYTRVYYLENIQVVIL